MFLLAAQLINAGRRLYFDFHCPHPPSYFYLLAWWMRAFGPSWRSAHVLSALLSGGAIAVVAAYVFTRLHDNPWRLPASLIAAALVGLNPIVLRSGVIGQYYGLLLLLVPAAFWLAAAAAARSPRFTVLPGIAAGAALSTSFLAAPIAPILLVWSVCGGPAGERLKRGAWFLAGAAIPFVPLLLMALSGFRYILYNVFLCHLLYRSQLGSWASADINRWNLNVLADWITTPANLAAALLATGGLWLAASGCQGLRQERKLCGWLAAGLGVYLALPRPTFLQYFVLLTPLLAILAAFGVAALGARYWPRLAPWWPAVAVSLFLAVWTARFIAHRQWEALHTGDWLELEAVGAEVNRVTAAGAPIYAYQDVIYFAAQRIPPPGLEHSFARQRVPPKAAAFLHFTPQEQFNQWLAEGRYDTVVVSTDSDEGRHFDLTKIYRQRRLIGGYTILWDRTPGSAGQSR